MSNNIYKFMTKKKIEQELHEELLTKLDRCMELSMMLEGSSTFKEEYFGVGEYVYRAFQIIEDLR